MVQQRELILKAYQEFSFWENAQNPKEEQKDLVFRKIYEDMLRCYDRVTLVLDAVDQSSFPDRLTRLMLPLANRLFDSNLQFRMLITSQQEIAWPKRTDEGLCLTVLSITKEDLSIDIMKFVHLCICTLQPPLNKGEQAKILTSCSKVASSGWPYIMHSIAKGYLHCQRFKEAQNMEEAVLEYMQDRVSVGSSSTIEYKRTLAIALSEQGYLTKAEEIQRHILDSYREAQSPQDNLHIQLMNDLSLTLSSAEKWEEARDIQTQLVKILSETKNKPKEMLKGVENNLAITYANLGLLPEAERLLRKCLESVTEDEDADSEAVCDAKCNLGQILARGEKWIEAEELEVGAMNARRRTLGIDNLKTIQSMSNVGWAKAQQGRFKEAMELQSQVLAGRTKLQGVGHPQTLAICGNLAWTVSQLGDRDEARRLARLALGYD